MAIGIPSLDAFSVYNNHADRRRVSKHPLPRLVPESYERGWHAARNLLKPLNHVDFLRRKDEIATRLNLHSLATPASSFESNFALLVRHQAGGCSTAEVIRRLALQTTAQGRASSEADVAGLLREYATVRHMEFHPSDVCNLTCRDCTYGHDDPERKPLPVNFPFAGIARIADLKPASMVVIGGGEPTLYRSGPHRFQEMIQEVVRTNPGVRLALVSNGTCKPPGDWPSAFSWLRLSLDAATPETYRRFRGKPLFHRVVENFLAYLDHDVPYVGISFLFARSNVHEYAQVAAFIFDLVRREKPRQLRKLNIQYRPLRRDPYRYGEPFQEAVTPEQIGRVVEDLRCLADSSREMAEFLRDQTNATAILGGNSHPPHEFSRCHYSQVFRIVRANGDLRPCFIRVSEPDFLVGNLLRDSLETVALNTLCIGARRKPHCDSHGCRQCHVNYTLEKGLEGALRPSTAPDVASDPMF